MALLAVSLVSARGFALLGPTGNGGDNWQIGAIGYPLGGDIGSPKNFGEGYRLNTPVLYYACDANFLTYFGSNGLAAVDSAFAILNNLTNVDSYSRDLSEFPLYSQHANYLAQSLDLRDLKSITLGTVFEEMGLADPVQYTWTLRSRIHVGNIGCPVGEEYLVVQRNFDINLDQPVVYTPYVNDTLYYYIIEEGCAAGAITEPLPADPFALVNTPVAAFAGTFIDDGYFYTGLTRDDVAGLRYLYSSNNIVMEATATGSLQLQTNSAPPELLTTQPFGVLLSGVQTNPPATIQTNFPGLEIGSSTNYFTNVITTNISIYYTNSPGPSVTNYQPVGQNSLVTTLDLRLFNMQAATNSPAQMLALYPGLVIASDTAYWTNIPTPNLVYTYQPAYGYPAGYVKVVTTTNGFTPNYFLFYTYQFGNIYTNSYSSNSYNTIQTIAVQTPNGSPVGTPGQTNITTTTILIHQPSGEFFIINTNWCGFKIVQTLGSQVMISTSNTVALTNYVGGVLYNGTQTTTTGFTNHTYVVEPGVCEPALYYSTNYTTNIVVAYQYNYGNIVTNFYTNNTTETILTTNIGACSNGLDGTLCTNVTQQQVVLTNVASGDFYIPGTNWCGYTILTNMQTTPVYTTNTIVATIPAGITNIGQQYTVTTISVYTNHIFLVAPLTCTALPDQSTLRAGIENVKYVRANYDSLISQLFQPITNTYTMFTVNVTNGLPVTQYLRRIVTVPDIKFTARDAAGFNGGYALTRNVNYNQANILPGLAGPGTLNPSITITYNRSTPFYYNSYALAVLNTNAFFTVPSETNQINFYSWGSFDFSTNPPIVYPNGNSIVNLENQLLVNITPPPPTLPDATNNVVYPITTFSASGGSFQPPFTWSVITNQGVLPMGLNLSSAGTISGTPTNNPVGTYDFVVQLTDSLLRTVSWNYSINVPQ